jgi:mannan endo-1,4-beta-mannosidase
MCQSLIPGTTPQINTGPNGLQCLGYVVQSAEAHGLKLINFVNNWSDCCGILAYNAYFDTNTTTWYTDPRVQAQYQKYVETVCRYRNSSAVFAWELANKPRCHGCGPSIFTT